MCCYGNTELFSYAHKVSLCKRNGLISHYRQIWLAVVYKSIQSTNCTWKATYNDHMFGELPKMILTCYSRRCSRWHTFGCEFPGTLHAQTLFLRWCSCGTLCCYIYFVLLSRFESIKVECHSFCCCRESFPFNYIFTVFKAGSIMNPMNISSPVLRYNGGNFWSKWTVCRAEGMKLCKLYISTPVSFLYSSAAVESWTIVTGC